MIGDDASDAIDIRIPHSFGQETEDKEEDEMEASQYGTGDIEAKKAFAGFLFRFAHIQSSSLGLYVVIVECYVWVGWQENIVVVASVLKASARDYRLVLGARSSEVNRLDGAIVEGTILY